MKLVLINPPNDQSSEGTYEKFMPHIGLAYLSSYVSLNKIECKIIDAKYEGIRDKEIIARIRSTNPDLIGITMMTEEFRVANHLASNIKLMFPKTPIVVGGAHPTAIPKETLIDGVDFDIAVIGEGESTLLELCQIINLNDCDLASVSGIAYRSKGKIEQTSEREKIIDLDTIPFPAWQHFNNLHTKHFPVLTGRGCPYKCIFCMRMSGNSPRFRSVANVVEEIQQLIRDYHCEYIYFCDETFTMNRDRLFDLCENIIQTGINKKLNWRCETRVNTVDPQMFEIMKSAGCETVGFGIESGNDKILKGIRKGITTTQARQAVKWAKQAGIKVETFFILGHPNETKVTIQDTINLARELNPYSAEFAIMTPLPGTEIARMAEKSECGLRLISKDYSNYSLQLSNSMELESLTINDLKRLQLKAYWSFWVRPGKLFTFLRIINIKRLPMILLHYLRRIVKK